MNTMGLGEQILTLVIYALAVARLVRLINSDTILDRPRLWLAGRARHHQLIAIELQAHRGKEQAYEHHRALMRRWQTAVYFVGCPWCVGMWLAIATAWLPLWQANSPVVQYLAVALAASHMVGVCARFADTEEVDITDDDEG